MKGINMKIKKRYVSILIIIVGIIYAFSNLKFKSVEQYNEEKAKGNPQIIFENGVTVSEEEVSEAVAEQIADVNYEDMTAETVQNEEDTRIEEQLDKSRNADGKDSPDRNTGREKQEKDDKQNKEETIQATAETKTTKQITTKEMTTETTTETTTEPVYYTCTFEVVCYELSDNPSLMAENYRDFIPKNGVIIQNSSVKVAAGTTVYDVLNAVCKSKGIAIDSVYNPFYKTYYVRGINNLYEKEAGDMSGWVYTVNGKSPMLGASSYKIKDNDSITWSYTTDGEM